MPTGDKSFISDALQTDYDSSQINILQETKLFDRKLKAKLAIKNDVTSLNRSLLYRKYISGPLYIVIFVYVLIMPFLTAPTWCAKYWDSIDRW